MRDPQIDTRLNTLAHPNENQQPFEVGRRKIEISLQKSSRNPEGFLEFLEKESRILRPVRIEVSPPGPVEAQEIRFWKQKIAAKEVQVEGTNVVYDGVRVVPRSMRIEIFKAAYCQANEQKNS